MCLFRASKEVISNDPAIVFQWLFDTSQPMDPNEVHGKALLILVHPRAQHALGSDRIVDPGRVLPGNGPRLEHSVAKFAVCPAVGQTDYGVIEGAGFLQELGV